MNFKGLKAKLQKWCYGGIDVADYHAASNAINAHNTHMAYKLNMLFAMVFMVLMVVSLTLPSYRDGFTAYMMFTIAHMMLTAQAKAKSREADPCNKEMILLSLVLFFVAMIVNKFFLGHDEESIFLIAYILVTSVCFIVPTCEIVGYQIAIFAIYMAFDYATKAPVDDIMMNGVKGTFSIIIGNVIGQALLQGQIARFNDLNRDGLTRIYNRRKINSFLPEAFKDMRGFAVAMFDIDYFKHFNDTYGHDNGDQVLIAVAQTLAKTAKEHNAFVGRYGGEEFLLVVHGEDAGSIIAGICEEARKRVSLLEILPRGCDTPVHVTVSVGYADKKELGITEDEPADNGHLDMIVEAADDAMYQSKHAGRNRVTAAAARICKIRRINGA
jgi:diguanylate cyclase (GGDEF)-like protein